MEIYWGLRRLVLCSGLGAGTSAGMASCASGVEAASSSNSMATAVVAHVAASGAPPAFNSAARSRRELAHEPRNANFVPAGTADKAVGQRST
jgi:hypothetical protein